jgi:predicted nucleic acid-binding protein
MNGVVLVDSSAWIEAVRAGGDPEMERQVGNLIGTGRAAMTEPVWMELYQGIRNKREEVRLEATRNLCVWLEFDAACWQLAAQTARACLRSGTNVPIGDILVDACARRHKVELLERDRHFAMIAKAVEN